MPGTSTPLTANQIRAALRKFGVRYREIAGWETRNRNGYGTGWGPVYGFIVHHTGDDAPDTADRNVIVRGRTDLPGPLAQFGGNDDGVIDLIGHGRANHAGTGDPDVLAAVRAESFGAYPPVPNQKTSDGNRYFYGLETYYSGRSAPEQYAAIVNLAAAICDAHGWSGRSVIGHKEWSYVKPDPGSVDMARFRRDVDARIRAVNTPTPPPPPAPAPDPALGGLTMADINTITAKLDELQAALGQTLTKADGSTLRNDLAWQNRQASALASQVTSLGAILAQLAAKADVDVDEQAIAADLVAALGPQIRESVASAVSELPTGAAAEDIAEAVLAKLGTKLTPPPPA